MQRLAGSGQMADRTRAFAWDETPLGPLATWPVSLRSTAALVLESRFPMTLWWGADLRHIYNDAYIPVLAGKHPDALGRPAADVWSEIWHILGPQSRRVLEGGGATWNEHLLLPMQRKGFLEETYFTFSYSPVRDDDGRIDGVLVTCQETTAQVQGERQLQLLRDLAARTSDTRSLDEVCAAAASVFDDHRTDVPFALLYLADAPDTLRLTASAGLPAGAAAAEYLSPQGRVGRWPLEVADVADARVTIVDVQEHLGPLPPGCWDRPPVRAAVVALAAGAGARPLGYLVAGLNPLREIGHGYAQLFGLAADQIARALAGARAFEEERRRAEALAEIDRQKSVFFSNVSHEFRTPLTLMIGPTEDALGSPGRALAGPALEAVYRNELRLLKLVNALLDFARLEAGRMVASFEAVDLARHTADLASTFRSAFERAGLDLTVTCDAVDDVYVDRGMWEKIVLNLLSNALKFTFDGGVAVRLAAIPGHVELTVRDTGIGIDAANLPHVFERFHRVEGARARTHEGSGIGLALVNDLVRLHGGTCTLDSAPGAGTTVTVTLPTGRAHLAAEQIRDHHMPTVRDVDQGPPSPESNPFVIEALRWLPADSASASATRAGDTEAGVTAAGDTAAGDDASGDRAHVLVVDDNADMRDYLQRLLAPLWSVEAACDGVEAREAAARRRPDLVLTDVMMPRLDGFGLLRALKEDPSTAAIPVIMLSARAGEEARIEGVQAGADEYLVKPFSARELIARVSAQLRLVEAAKERASLLQREQHARESAEHQRRQLRAIFDQAPTLIAVFRGPDHVVELANDHICSAWGRRQDDVVGRPFYDAVPEARDQTWRSLLNRVYATGEPYVGREVPAQFERNGRLETSYYDFVWAPLREDDRIHGIIVVATDVTEQAVARRELSGLREAAEAANRAKDEFLAMLGHELRNPLAPIMTALQLLKLRGVEAAERERAIIERQVRHLVTLVDDLLDVSRITRGKLEIKRTFVELADVVAKAIEMASPLLEQQRHDLRVDVPRRGLGLIGDGNRLAQVVGNLLNNAAKYTEPGGVVHVSAGLEDGWVVLHVRDEGVGIAPEMLPRVFDLFVQEGQTLARSRGGLGLGLTIARSLVAMHGGLVTAESAGHGRGSTFSIRLPHVQMSASLPAAEVRTPPAGAGAGIQRRVLVVDDNVDAAELLGEILVSFGYAVHTVHDGPSALAAADAFRPDVALLDIGLPVMDGYELAHRLTRHPGMEGVRLVAVTGYGQRQDRERSAEAGFHAHLVKPLDANQLHDTLAQLAPAAASGGSGWGPDGPIPD
ncbi:MAG: ATP-binding protein [Vicinamibacterales bacterium]